MANIPLKTIKFPGLANTYTIPEVSTDLTASGKAAEAAKVGAELANLGDQLDTNTEDIDKLKADLDAIEPVTDDIKTALLDLVSHIALFDDGGGQEYCDALRDALYRREYPDLRTGEIHQGGYYDASGNVVDSTILDGYNDKYFPIMPDTNYVWIKGFDGYVRKSNNVLYGRTVAMRVCYYDENKEFISREVNDYSTDIGYVEQRYLTLDPPEGAAYFRVSWSGMPVGNIYRSIPTNLYAVSIVLANLDDSNIPSNTKLMNGITIKRNGVGILREAVYGRNDIDSPDYSGEIPNNNSVATNTYIWYRNVFSVLQGGSPESSEQNPDTLKRIQSRYSFLLKKGDVISFSGVKAGVRAERISDGHVQYTTSWITTDTDFVVGGDE